MVYSFHFRFLNNVNLEELTDVFNQSYIDPFSTSAYSQELLISKIKDESISLSNSIGVYANKKLVGFILHAKINQTLYNRASGILPAFRGNQLTRKMYDYALPILRSFNTKKIGVEVGHNQEYLNKIYRRLGFKKWRTLTSVQGILHAKKQLDQSVKNIEILPMKYYEYLIHYAEKDILPTWANSDYYIKENQHHLVLRKVVQDGLTLGYIVADKEQNQIHQIWIKETYRRKGIANMLVAHIIGANRSFMALNIDIQNFGVNAFFKSIGGKEFYIQNEMELYL